MRTPALHPRRGSALHPRRGSARPERPTSVLLAITAVVILLGAVAGMIWASLTPPSTGVVIDGAGGDIPVDFDGIGAFALVMFGYGGVAALVVWLAAKPWRGVVGFVWPALGTVAGAALAATAGMRIAGLRFHDDPADLPVGTMYRVVPELWLEGTTRAGQSASWTLLICAPFAFALVYLVCVLSSRTADLGVGDLDLHDPSAEELTSAGAASRTHR